MGNIQTGTKSGTTATRAIAVVGPAATGKTSLAEALLFASGAITRQGTIDAGNTVGDASPEARARGGSTELNLSHFTYLDQHFALLDIPGGAGFAADGLAALQSVDLAIVVIDPAPERATLAEPVLRQLDAWNVPHALFINKIENAQAGTIHALIAELQPLSREPLALRQIPLREADRVTGYVDLALERAYRYRPGKESERVAIPADIAAVELADRARLLETLADFDDDLLETLLLDEAPDPALVMRDLADDTAQGKVVPVLLGSAQTGGGVHRLLKLLRHEAPDPGAAAQRLGIGDGEAALHVFKIAHGGAMGRLALGRVLGGTLREGSEFAADDGHCLRAGSIFSVQGERTAKQGMAQPGDVIAVAKIDGVRGGMILRSGSGQAGSGRPELLVVYPPRNVALAIRARDRRDDVKLATALHRLREEDPALEWIQDEATHETVLRGINDEHLGVVLGRLARRYGVEVDHQPPRIAYRESIRTTAVVRGRHKKQSGGHGQYGDCIIELRPTARGEGFVFEDRIAGGVIPRQYIPAVEAGLRDAMARGPLGFPVVDVAVRLIDGSFHAVDSSELAFRTAGRIAMADALAQAAPYVLEPVMRVVVDCPHGSSSRIGSALSARRGQIVSLTPHPDWARWERIEGLVPEAGLYGFDAELRSLSQGLASHVAHHHHLAELSGKSADEVIRAEAARAAAQH